MKSLLAKCLAIATLVAVTALGSATAHADSMLNQNLPISGSDVNPCNGEPFTYSGVLHTQISMTIAADGSIHFGVHQNFADVHAVGSSGTLYVIPGTENFVGNLTPPQHERTFTTNTPVISQGSAPNFYFHFLNHLTINANGDPTVTVLNISTSCQG